MPKELIEHAKKVSKMLGCNKDDFSQTALNDSTQTLFSLEPEKIKNNACESAGQLGWIFADFVEAALKQPQFFCMKPDTISKKLKLENYYRKIQNKEVVNKFSRFDSDEKVYSKILGTLIKNTDRNLINNVNDYRLEQFLTSNPDKTFSIEIPRDELAEDFIKFVQETSIKTIGKNIFEFKQI